MDDPDHNRLRILIVEDQFLIAKQVEMILRCAGHDVVGTAATMEEALALAETTRPSLALVDMSLADGVTGGIIGKFIVDSYETQVVFTTANVRRIPDDFCGAIGVVEKPFTRTDILATITYLIARMRSDTDCPPKPKSLQLSPLYSARWEFLVAA